MKEFPGYCNTIIKQGNMHSTPSKLGVTSKSVPHFQNLKFIPMTIITIPKSQ